MVPRKNDIDKNENNDHKPSTVRNRLNIPHLFTPGGTPVVTTLRGKAPLVKRFVCSPGGTPVVTTMRGKAPLVKKSVH